MYIYKHIYIYIYIYIHICFSCCFLSPLLCSDPRSNRMEIPLPVTKPLENKPTEPARSKPNNGCRATRQPAVAHHVKQTSRWYVCMQACARFRLEGDPYPQKASKKRVARKRRKSQHTPTPATSRIRDHICKQFEPTSKVMMCPILT